MHNAFTCALSASQHVSAAGVISPTYQLRQLRQGKAKSLATRHLAFKLCSVWLEFRCSNTATDPLLRYTGLEPHPHVDFYSPGKSIQRASDKPALQKTSSHLSHLPISGVKYSPHGDFKLLTTGLEKSSTLTLCSH